jgi:thiamine biosynthesis lipoprotein
LINETQKAQMWFEDWEQSFSRFRLTSELSEINRHPGYPVKVSDAFYKVMTTALDAEVRTNGLVTPAILNALEYAGYTTSFENLSDSLGSVLRQPFIATPGSKSIQLDKDDQTVTLPFGIQIDLGGIAKGWAAHETMLRLGSLSPVIVDAGGDIAISGPRLDGSAWPIGVANPFDKENNLELLMLTGGGIATSGRDYRRWFANNNWQHHIIDPRINSPADTDVITATVLAENAVDAEVFAKVGLILGSQDGPAWLDNQDNTQYLLVLEDGKIIKSPGFYKKQWNEKWSQTILNQ